MIEPDARGELEEPAQTWVLIASDDVPEQWRHRCIQVSMVRLLPGEASRLLSGSHNGPTFDHEDEELANLLADGVRVEDIADRMHMTRRSVYRRIARLRAELGVATVTELATKLSRLGFGGA
jgi:DNA-binding NarL/FixJ family response regulator